MRKSADVYDARKFLSLFLWKLFIALAGIMRKKGSGGFPTKEYKDIK